MFRVGNFYLLIIFSMVTNNVVVVVMKLARFQGPPSPQERLGWEGTGLGRGGVTGQVTGDTSHLLGSHTTPWELPHQGLSPSPGLSC